MKKIKIGFFYPKYFPVNGGLSVHGYNLIKNLATKNVTILTVGQFDGISKSYKKNILNFLKILLISNIIYVRISSGKGFNNLIPFFCSLLRKKVMIELNGPSDEIIKKGGTINDVIERDKILRKRLVHGNKIIVVSNELKTYLINILNINKEKILVIPNGGEKYDNDKTLLSKQDLLNIDNFKSSYTKIVFWSGTPEPWQAFDKITNIIDNSPKDIGFIIVCNKKLEGLSNNSNVLCFNGLKRDSVLYIMSQCNIGLALYGNYDWSRIGFFNSSLKFFEYLANNLFVIASQKGQLLDYGSNPNVFLSDDTKKIIDKIISYTPTNNSQINFRTWKDVSDETFQEISNLLKVNP